MKKLGIIIATFFIMTVSAYSLYNYLIFRVVNTNPDKGSVATVTPVFSINFNKSLSATGLQLAASDNSFTSYSINGRSLLINLNTPLQAGKTYTFVIKHVNSSSGKRIDNRKFQFSPKYIPELELPADQKNTLLAKQSQYKQKVDNSLIRFLPFVAGGLEFRVDYNIAYINSVPKITIVVTSNTEKGHQDAQDWIKSLGYNPNNYSLQLQTGPVMPLNQ